MFLSPAGRMSTNDVTIDMRLHGMCWTELNFFDSDMCGFRQIFSVQAIPHGYETLRLLQADGQGQPLFGWEGEVKRV